MASNGFPKVTAKAWRTLRTRAASAPSTRFTPATVAALMGMANPKSAADNTVYPMRRLGLIDDEGVLTERGNKWRTDGSFGAACDEILEDVYPAELATLVDDHGNPDQQHVRTWFDHKGFGDSNARQMAATYVMIASKTIPEPMASSSGGATKPPAKKAVPPKRTADAKKRDATDRVPPPPPVDRDQRHGAGPNVHLDIQIHIPAAATAQQIDQIFASMARHLYDKR